MPLTQPPWVPFDLAMLRSLPTSYWIHGEDAGARAVDAIGSRPGAYGGSPTFGVTGPIASDPTPGVLFNGSTQYASVPHAAALNLGNTFTLGLWIKRADAVAQQALISRGSGTAILLIGDANAVYLTRHDVAHMAHSSFAITDTAWHWVVATKAATVSKIYIDGADVTVVDGDSTMVDSTYALQIGRRTTNDDLYFNGAVHRSAVWATRALPAAEIARLYALARAA